MMEFADDTTAVKKKASPKTGKARPDVSVGEILRRTRLQYNITFDQAELDLRIKAEHLEALERNAIDKLPGRVYVFGYIRTYSNYLGLDGDKMVAKLKRQEGRKIEKVQPKLRVKTLEDDNNSILPSGAAIAICGIALIATFILISVMTSQQSPREIPSVPKELTDRLTVPNKPAEMPAKLSDFKKNGDPAVAPIQTASQEMLPAPHPIVLKAVQNTWIEIRNSDAGVVFSRVLNKGEEYWVPNDQTALLMTMGNAGGLQIIVQGQALPFLGSYGQVKRNVPLNIEALQQIASKSQTLP